MRNAESVKVLAKRFGIGQWSFIGPGSEKKWYPSENSPQGVWDNIAEDMMLQFAESGHPIFRATTPLSRGQLKSKGRGKLSIHFTADQDTVETIYRIILSVNQLARRMGSPRQVSNRRRRTREGPEPACVQTPFDRGVAHAGVEG